MGQLVGVHQDPVVSCDCVGAGSATRIYPTCDPQNSGISGCGNSAVGYDLDRVEPERDVSEEVSCSFGGGISIKNDRTALAGGGGVAVGWGYGNSKTGLGIAERGADSGDLRRDSGSIWRK